MRCHFMVILLLGVSVASISGYGEICSVGDVELDFSFFGHYNPTEFKSSYTGVLEEFDIENVIGTTFENSKYLDVEIDKENKKLRVRTSKDFPKYEEEGTTLDIEVTWKVMCDNGKKQETYELQYHQKIVKENKHAPAFDQNQYDYVFYGDLPKKFELTEVIPIKASDKDIYIERLAFSISKDDFGVWSSSIKDKTVYADLETRETIKASKDETKYYNLTVEDGSTWTSSDVKSSTVVLTLRVEKPDEVMAFEKTQYEASLMDAEKLELSEDIRLVNGLDHSIEVTVRSDYKDYFSTSIDIIRGTINVQVTQPLPLARDYAQIEVWLDAYWKGITASTKIVISPKKEIAKLCYVYGMDLNEDKYNGVEIKENHRGVIKEYDTLNVEYVKCDGEKAKYISCEFNSNKLVLSVTPEYEKYEENESKAWFALNMSIKCPKEVVQMEYVQRIDADNTHDPEFDREKYEYIFYNELPGNLRLTNILPITVSDKDIGNIVYECNIAPGENEMFNQYLSASMGRLDGKEAKCYVDTRKTMSPGFEQEFTIIASDGNYPPRKSSTTISIKVIKDEEQLRFKHPEINAVLKNNVVDVIELENGFDSDTEFSIRSEYSDYFRVSKNILDAKIEITAIKDLSEITVDIVRIIVEAKWHGLTDTSTIYIYMNGELPPIIITTERPTVISQLNQMKNFDTWIMTLNVLQIVSVSVVGTTLCALAYIAKRYYY